MSLRKRPCCDSLGKLLLAAIESASSQADRQELKELARSKVTEGPRTVAPAINKRQSHSPNTPIQAPCRKRRKAPAARRTVKPRKRRRKA